MYSNYVVKFKDITKDFSGVRALDKVSLGIRPGKVHTLVGENGAGKSTLMKVLNGSHRPNAGKIYIDDKEVNILDTIDARKKGIAMIYQELNYVSELSIEENVFLGRYPDGKIKGTINWKEVRRQTEEFLSKEGLSYNPAMKIKYLSISDIQMLEIMKAISFDAKVIVMDEPTSSITIKEIDVLFKRIAELKSRNIAIIYISHKMDEIFKISDDISVLRDGVLVSSGAASDYDVDILITQMVGREIKNVYPKEVAKFGDESFQLKNFTSYTVFEDVNLTVRKGEILGLAGLIGAGRTEVARAIVGLDTFSSGKVFVEGKEIKIKNVQTAMKSGVIMVSEDRREYGIIGCRNLIENATLSDNCLSKGFIAGIKQRVQKAISLMKTLSVKAPNFEVNIENLSGGNQQKVVLAKWLMLDAKILILDEPTRGIDVGAKYEIYKLICKLAQEGYAIILISSEIPELLGMADRIQVMYKGKMSDSVDRKDFSQELVMKYALGGFIK